MRTLGRRVARIENLVNPPVVLTDRQQRVRAWLEVARRRRQAEGGPEQPFDRADLSSLNFVRVLNRRRDELAAEKRAESVLSI
jgi:hypothetical protein